MSKEPIQILYSFRPSEPLGLFMDQTPRPRQSIMQMMLLEREAMRHFPNMTAKARAEYVAYSIEHANKLPETDPI